MATTQTNDSELFAHVSWNTQSRKPLLACDELRQAAYEAVKTRSRSHLCRVLAIGSTNTQMHLIVRFPASLPVSQVARLSMQASGDAMSRLFLTLHSHVLNMETVWDKTFKAQTLNSNEAADAVAYLQTEIQKSAEQFSKNQKL